jgi:hypothetical protein
MLIEIKYFREIYLTFLNENKYFFSYLRKIH